MVLGAMEAEAVAVACPGRIEPVFWGRRGSAMAMPAPLRHALSRGSVKGLERPQVTCPRSRGQMCVDAEMAARVLPEFCLVRRKLEKEGVRRWPLRALFVPSETWYHKRRLAPDS